ncbi:guanylate kinase [Lactobacillus xylocopicola]|uniref:Guanylate kinase n=1 Tax=Lactobacillus xylocopicola TaxID=2976676 RepID=A0ABN6SN86_9LACO|nr:AAA family ATPase [Lactobacillus xylocopicola]BDR61044.1 guanylate kinase [Lactobacillus xylocopicola]
MQKLILIAGPSGAGKTTISDYLRANFKIPRVLTHTTRPLRVGEQPDRDYHFESDATFSRLHFFEHVKYGSYQYGSSEEALREAWREHELVSLIVDIKGAAAYLQVIKGQVYFLYVTTSTRAELQERLSKRGDDPLKIQARLSGSELNELPPELAQDAHILVNDDWSKTKKELDKLAESLLQR